MSRSSSASCGVEIRAAGDLGDLLQRRLVQLRVDREPVDVQRRAVRAADADGVDAHAALGGQPAPPQAGRGRRCSRRRSAARCAAGAKVPGGHRRRRRRRRWRAVAVVVGSAWPLPNDARSWSSEVEDAVGQRRAARRRQPVDRGQDRAPDRCVGACTAEAAVAEGHHADPHGGRAAAPQRRARPPWPPPSASAAGRRRPCCRDTSKARITVPFDARQAEHGSAAAPARRCRIVRPARNSDSGRCRRTRRRGPAARRAACLRQAQTCRSRPACAGAARCSRRYSATKQRQQPAAAEAAQARQMTSSSPQIQNSELSILNCFSPPLRAASQSARWRAPGHRRSRAAGHRPRRA